MYILNIIDKNGDKKFYSGDVSNVPIINEKIGVISMSKKDKNKNEPVFLIYNRDYFKLIEYENKRKLLISYKRKIDVSDYKLISEKNDYQINSIIKYLIDTKIKTKTLKH